MCPFLFPLLSLLALSVALSVASPARAAEPSVAYEWRMVPVLSADGQRTTWLTQADAGTHWHGEPCGACNRSGYTPGLCWQGDQIVYVERADQCRVCRGSGLIMMEYLDVMPASELLVSEETQSVQFRGPACPTGQCGTTAGYVVAASRIASGETSAPCAGMAGADVSGCQQASGRRLQLFGGRLFSGRLFGRLRGGCGK